jgi:hypothetical protein
MTLALTLLVTITETAKDRRLGALRTVYTPHPHVTGDSGPAPTPESPVCSRRPSTEWQIRLHCGC